MYNHHILFIFEIKLDQKIKQNQNYHRLLKEVIIL
jgi:hypothetical protein